MADTPRNPDTPEPDETGPTERMAGADEPAGGEPADRGGAPAGAGEPAGGAPDE